MSKKMCSNCDRYPLCDKCKKPTGICDDYKKDKLIREMN